jgi:hypothetical protein
LLVMATVIIPIVAQPSLTFSLFGLRWMLPLILTAFIIDFVDRTLLENVGKVVLFMYFLHFLTQLTEIVWMPPFFGTTILEITRAQGLFSIANSGAMFTVFSLYFAMFYSAQGRLRSFVLLTAPLSLVFVASGTGIILGIILYIFFWFWRTGSTRSSSVSGYFRVLIFFVLCFVPVVALVFLNEITGRGDDYVEISGGGRLFALLESLSNASWLSTVFGAATNTAVLAVNSGIVDDYGAFGSDSMFQSLVINLGLPLAFLFLMLPLISIALKKSEFIPRMSFLFIVVGAYSVTQIVEIFPLNLLFSVLLAYFSSSTKLIKPEKYGCSSFRMSAPIGDSRVLAGQ